MKWRLWLLSFGIILVCVIILMFATTQVYYQSSIDDSKEYLRVYMNAFDEAMPIRELTAPTENIELTEVINLTEQNARRLSERLNGARITFMDSQGNVLADSMAEAELENHAERSEIKDAILHGEGFAVRGSSTFGKNMVYFCKNFGGAFLVRIAVFTNSDWRLFAGTLPALLEFSAILIVLCAIIAIVTTHCIITPVKKLAEDAAANVCVSSKYPELQPVAEILNERSRNIQRQMDELQAEKEIVEKARVSKDEFISNVTHEMNTPLTSIHGYAELLQSGGMSDEQKETAYKTILAQSERLTNLIACIINYSEIDSDDLPHYEVDFSALAKETLCALKPEADKRNITLAEHIDDNVIIMSRHERLSEIFGNLVRNAIKYNKDGGSITVTLNRRSLSVKDTGIGIAQENLDKVFSRFFTVDKSHSGKNGGFGLGLAVAKKICQKSGWKISVESTLGEGSTFTVRF